MLKTIEPVELADSVEGLQRQVGIALQGLSLIANEVVNDMRQSDLLALIHETYDAIALESSK